MNFTTGTAEILVVVEGFPQSQQRLCSWLGTSVEQDTDLGVQNAAEGGEQPSMGVDLFAVLLLQTEDHLDRWQGRRAIVVRSNQLLVGSDGQLRGVLENMSRGLLAVDVTLHDTILVNADGGKQVESALVARVDTIEDETDDNLLPRGATLVPEL